MLKMILAMEPSGAIGYDGGLPWGNAYPKDLDIFKEKTSGDSVIMGRETFLSLKRFNGLPNRSNIVITSKPLDVGTNVFVMTLPELLRVLQTCTARTYWAIGGKGIYEALFPYCRELHITKIADHYLGDTFIDPKFGYDRPTVSIETEHYDDDGFHIEILKY